MISESIFRENDIRGTYPEELNESVIKEIAKGIAKKCFQEDISLKLVISRQCFLHIIVSRNCGKSEIPNNFRGAVKSFRFIVWSMKSTEKFEKLTWLRNFPILGSEVLKHVIDFAVFFYGFGWCLLDNQQKLHPSFI